MWFFRKREVFNLILLFDKLFINLYYYTNSSKNLLSLLSEAQKESKKNLEEYLDLHKRYEEEHNKICDHSDLEELLENK